MECIRMVDTTRIIITRIITIIIILITIHITIITTITSRIILTAITTAGIKMILQSPETRTLFLETSCYVRGKLF
jgi:hypothetical protein